MAYDVMSFIPILICPMPFKQKHKTPSTSPRKKPQYKVKNWTEYNKSLKNRGDLSLYFPPGDLKTNFINDDPYIPGVSGQQSTYKPPYIELIYTFYRLFCWGIRQMTGYFEHLWKTKKLDICVPSFGHLSDLFASLPVKVKQFCDQVVKTIRSGESVALIFDSTGLRFDKASHWFETKYKKHCNITPWRKMHLSMDPDMNIHGIEITDCETSDIEMMDSLMATPTVDKVIADGGYYGIETSQNLYEKGIIPVIPPPSHAVVHGTDATSWHDTITQYIKEKGTVYAFHKKFDYGQRSLIEAQISRIKRCIGSRLKTQRTESQKSEGTIIANIINIWNSFGRCSCVKIG